MKLAFSLAFATEPNSPDLRFAVCQHHFPENFWNPAFQVHANGTQGVPGVVMVANDPASHRDFLKAYTGAGEIASGAADVTARTENGEIDILPPSAACDLFAAPVKASKDGLHAECDALCRCRSGTNGCPVSAKRTGRSASRGKADCAAGRSLWRNPDIRSWCGGFDIRFSLATSCRGRMSNPKPH